MTRAVNHHPNTITRVVPFDDSAAWQMVNHLSCRCRRRHHCCHGCRVATTIATDAICRWMSLGGGLGARVGL